MNHKTQTKLCGLSLVASLLGILVAPAAPISWTSTPYPVDGSFGQFLNTGVFATTGTQILAENIGGAATTFDSINFTAGTTVFDGVYGGFHDVNVPSPLLSRDGTWGNAGAAGTVSLIGLTSGNSYRVQALVYDGRGDVGIPGRTVKFDGIDQGQYANGVAGSTWGNGLLVTGTFVADATTQNFTVEAFLGAASKGGQLNALLVHEFIPGTPALASPTVNTITTTGAQANVTLSNVGADVTLHWDTVDQDTGAWTHSNPLGAQVVGPVSGTITGLTADTLYFYRFHAVKTAAAPYTEAWSTAGTSFATALTGLAPTASSARTYSKTEIDVEWTDNFNTETGFIIERSPTGTDSWIQAGTTGADSQVFYDSGLLPGTTYYYRVLAENGAGPSDASSVVNATTDAPTPGINVEAWFQMGDAGQGTNNLPVDNSTNTRDFTGNASAATVTPSGGGYNDDAYYTFNGVDQGYYGIGYDAPENNVGIEVWVRTSDVGQFNHHVFGTGANTNGINIGYDADPGNGSAGWFGAIADVAFVGTVGTSNYTGGEWIHLAVVRDNGTTTFYVNGDASGTSTSTPLNATQPQLAVNAGGLAGGYFGGDVAEARIFTFDPGQFSVSDLLYPGTGPSDPYAAWAAGLADPSVNLDFDKGGLATGIEWVTGGDPADGSDDASVTPSFDNISDPNNFLFIFRSRDAAAADSGTTIVVEYGSDLGGWRNTTDHGVADGVTIDASTDLGGGFHQVTVSIPRTLAVSGKLFARLKVARP